MFLVISGHRVRDAKTLRDCQLRIAQHWKWERVLLQQQIILMNGLRGDGHEQRTALA